MCNRSRYCVFIRSVTVVFEAVLRGVCRFESTCVSIRDSRALSGFMDRVELLVRFEEILVNTLVVIVLKTERGSYGGSCFEDVGRFLVRGYSSRYVYFCV